MKRKLGAVLFVIYSIIAITVTVLLLSFNDYNCSEIGGYTVYIVKDDALEPEYQEGSILLVKNTNDKHVQIGDEVFFYKVINSEEFEFVSRTLEGKRQQGRHVVYDVGDGESYVTEYFIGRAEDTIVINGPWGTLLSLLESKWGYLFCIVIVSLLLFLQEVFDLIIELKYGSKATNGKTQKSSTSKATTKTVAKKSTAAAGATAKATTVAKKVATTAEVNNTQSGVKEEG